MSGALVNRPPVQKSALRAGDWNAIEMALAHAIGISCVKHGPRSSDIADALSRYRELIITRLERAKDDGDLEQAIQDIREGRLA